MDVRSFLSKERLVNSIKSLGRLRIRTNHSLIITLSALMLILFIAFVIRLFPIRWEIQTGSLHLSEFDPYLQFRFTKQILSDGPVSWVNTLDPQRWYPHGIRFATHYPGLPFTAAFFYSIFSVLGINIELMDFCSLFPPIMGMLACLVIYFLGKDIGGKPLGLFAALFLALNPSYIQRTSLGFFDDEAIGVFSLLLFMFLFLRSIEEERPATSTVKYAIASGLTLGYFCSGWGAAYYPIAITTLFVFSLILLKRYSQHLLLSYSLTFGLGLFIAINVPRLSANYLTGMAVLPVAGVFILLILSEIFRKISSARSRTMLVLVFLVLVIGGFAVLWQLGYARSVGIKFLSVINPSMRGETPILESVAEHRISAWGSMYYDLSIGIIFFAVSLFFILGNLNNNNLFLLIFGLTSLYFASSMVRLLVLMAPAFSLLVALGITGILKPFKALLSEPAKVAAKKKYALERVGKEFSGAAVFLIFLVLMTNFAFPMPKVYRQADVPITITAGSLPIVPNQPVNSWMDALTWMSNLESPSTTVVGSWWDYGYWLTALGNVTTLCDNGTQNSTQIGLVGRAFVSNEERAVRILKEQFNGPHGPPTYILVYTTFTSQGEDYGYGGDEGKWFWMARIANSSAKVRELYAEEWGEFIYNEWGPNKQNNTFGNAAERVFQWNERGQNTTIYKLMQMGKYSKVPTAAAPELTYFRNPRFFGDAVAVLGTDSEGNPVYLYALVCVYEIDYAKYDLDHPEL